jgi:hypothetical protein
MEHGKRQRITAMSTMADIELRQKNDGTLIGKLSCRYFEEPFIFTDFVDMVEMMEIMFDTKGFPERQLLPRSFNKTKKRIKKNELDLSEVVKERSARQGDGLEADSPSVARTSYGLEPSPKNFELLVRFRHKAEWQGSLLWREKGVINHFSSIVELTRLFNEALGK